MSYEAKPPKPPEEERQIVHSQNIRLASNTAAGFIGVGLGTASAVGVSPAVLPIAIAGGAAAYFLSNQIDRKITGSTEKN